MIREVTNMNKHELYHNHNYVYLLTSNIINRCGDSLDTILFTWLVYLLTNSAGWSAIIFGINQAYFCNYSTIYRSISREYE